MARRHHSPRLLMSEIERLQSLGYTNAEIGKKLDMPDCQRRIDVEGKPAT